MDRGVQPEDYELYANYIASRQQPRGLQSFARGGLVSQVNPFYTYLMGIKSIHRLDDAPPITNGIPSPAPALSSPMQPVGLSSLVPLPPGDPVTPQKYASGGLVLGPYRRALLDAIAAREAPAYNVIYGGQRFSDYSRHPGIDVPIKSGPNVGKTSSAAGRYQFIEPTWNSYQKKLGLPDFSPANQDKAAWALARDVYHRQTGNDLDAVLQNGSPEQIAGVGRALHSTWTSLPGGIEQGAGANQFVNTYQSALQSRMAAATPATVATSATVPANLTATAPQTAQTAQMAQSAQAAAPVYGAVDPMALQQTASAANAADAANAAASADPFGGLLSLMMMASASPAPAPVASGGPVRKAAPVDPELETARTSQTPNAYADLLRRKRSYG